MKLLVQARRALALVAVLAISLSAASSGLAAGQKLSDLAFSSYHVDAGVVAIDTSGSAKLHISFLTPTMARIQIFPTGVISTNPSPAVAGVMPPLHNVRVSNQKDVLVIKTRGLSLHVDKAHLHVDAYDADDQHPLTLESPDSGTSWDTDTGWISQSRVLTDAEHIYGLARITPITARSTGAARSGTCGPASRSVPATSPPIIRRPFTCPPARMVAVTGCLWTTSGTCGSTWAGRTRTCSPGRHPAARSITISSTARPLEPFK
jgi:hypothetical protein